MAILRWCRLAFWVNVILLACLLGALAGLHESRAKIRGLLVETRNSLTTKASSDSRLFNLLPAEFVSHNFYVDSPAVLDMWRARLRRTVSIRVGSTTPLDEIELVKAIVLSFSRGGGRAIYRLPLERKISEAQNGGGFCSDHVEIFLALSLVNGIGARETQNAVHGFADFFSRSRGKWIFVDPLYAILARDESGEFLSSLELRQRRVRGFPVRFEFFGAAVGGIQSESDPRFQALYDAAQFRRFVLTYGNNVLTEASRSDLLSFLPWEVRQLILYLSGTKPYFLVLEDSFSDQGARAIKHRYVALFFAVFGYFVIALSCYPLVVLCRRLTTWSRRRRARSGQTDPQLHADYERQ